MRGNEGHSGSDAFNCSMCAVCQQYIKLKILDLPPTTHIVHERSPVKTEDKTTKKKFATTAHAMCCIHTAQIAPNKILVSEWNKQIIETREEQTNQHTTKMEENRSFGSLCSLNHRPQSPSSRLAPPYYLDAPGTRLLLVYDFAYK